MGKVLFIIVLLAALLTIVSGVWVAIGLMAALRHPNGAATAEKTPPPDAPA